MATLPRRRALLPPLLVLVAAGVASGYGYTKDEDPLLLAFKAAVRAARGGDFAASRAQVELVKWQTDELKGEQDLQVDFGPALVAAQGDDSSEAKAIHAWSNLLYLALVQKFHWNLTEQLKDYHKARARLDSAQAYYEVALAGNVKRADAARKQKDPRARSRHADIVAQFERAKSALGSPGLFGTGARPPDVATFKESTVRIAGHLKAVFPTFVRPGAKKPEPKRPR